jgi:HlyD family secretion protein
MVVTPLLIFSARANRLRSNAPDQNLQFDTVRRGSLEVAVSAVGAIEAEAVANLSFTRPGRVVEVLVQPGDGVKAGDPLLRLGNEVEQIALEQAQLSLQLARLQRQDLNKPADDASIKVAEANLNSAWGAYLGLQKAVTPEDIRSAEIKHEQAKKAQEDAEYARTHAQGGQPEAFYQRLDAQIGAASFNTEIAQLQLETLRNPSKGQFNAAYARVIQAKRELERVKAGPTQAEVDRADIAIQQAQAQLDQAQMNLSRMTLTAPFDGVVSQVNIEAGALVAPGLPTVQLTNVSSLHVTVQVDEVDIRQIRAGLPVRLRLDALPSLELPGRVDKIALVGNSSNGIINYDVRLVLNASDPRVRIGMTTDAAIIVEERQDVLLVPNQYIRLDRQRDKAFVNLAGEGGKVTEVEVQLGLRGQDSSEILSGLRPGDQVAVNLSGDRFSFFGR